MATIDDSPKTQVTSAAPSAGDTAAVSGAEGIRRGMEGDISSPHAVADAAALRDQGAITGGVRGRNEAELIQKGHEAASGPRMGSHLDTGVGNQLSDNDKKQAKSLGSKLAGADVRYAGESTGAAAVSVGQSPGMQNHGPVMGG